MCDVFPASLEPNRTFLPKPEVLSRIQSMVTILRSLNIPIRISIGDRTNASPSSGLDGSLYFGDYKTFVGMDDDKEERLLPTQACFNLTPIAHMIDELSIQYPADVPGVSGYVRAHRRQSPAEKILMNREMTGWRRFWARYASQLTNLKKLTANIPNDIYEDWAKSELPLLLADERWEMLEVPDNQGDFGFFGRYFPFEGFRYSFSRKKGRVKFVQRVFFRRDDKPLHLTSPHESLSEQEREERHIPESEIADKNHSRHRFWRPKEETTMNGDKKGKANAGQKVGGGKRKANQNDTATEENKRQKLDEETA